MTTIDIVALPVTEKLKLMETLWDSLCAQPEGVASPSWHRAVLEERLRRLASGEEAVSPWKEAKERVRAQSKAN